MGLREVHEDEDESLPEADEAEDEDGDEHDADAALHLKLKNWFSPAARRAIRGESKGALRHWKLTDILIYDINKPPSGIKKTKGSATM
ncbi:hypothetical protein OC834_006304, partial [Tilletia horrida]